MCATVDFLINHMESGIASYTVTNHIKRVIRTSIINDNYLIFRALLIFQTVQARFNIRRNIIRNYHKRKQRHDWSFSSQILSRRF